MAGDIPEPRDLPVSQLTKLRGGGEHDSYWRTVDYMSHSSAEMRKLMKQRGLKDLYVAAAPMLNKYLQRHDQGQLHYENRSDAELKILVEERTGVTDAGQYTRMRGIHILRQADQGKRVDWERVITKNILPAELRDIVYTIYCLEFAHEALHMPASPPLARANNLLRGEVLPIYYKTCLFSIGLPNTRYSGNIDHPRFQPGGQHLRHQMIMHPKTVAFFGTLAPEMLRSIRRLQIRIVLADVLTREAKLSSAYVTVTVKSPGNDDVEKVGVEAECRYEGGSEFEDQPVARLGIVKREVLSVARAIVARGGEGRRLRFGDVYSLRNAVEAAWKDKEFRRNI